MHIYIYIFERWKYRGYCHEWYTNMGDKLRIYITVTQEFTFIYITLFQFSIQLGTWYSTLWNAQHYGRHFTVVSLPGHCYTLWHSYCWGGATPSQINSLGSIQACCLMQGSASFFHLALVGSTRAHSLTVDRSTVFGLIPTDHTCSFMCTSHIDMTVHNPAFLQVR